MQHPLGNRRRHPFRAVVWTLAIALSFTLGQSSCQCSGNKIERPYPAPTAETVLAHLAKVRQNARAFQVESVMDYWVGKERVKGTVLLMGQVGSQMRINALSPTGDNVAADLACDGLDFQFIDYTGNCQLTGPCNRDSVARLLRVSLDPDDFLLLVVGTTPVIQASSGTLAWDASKGQEVVTLVSDDGMWRQTIRLDGREQRWDVLSSVVKDASGKVVWNLLNKDFRSLTSEDGIEFRVPGKTRFEQPREKADLLVRWVERTLNPSLDPAKFQMSIPPGLKPC